MTIGQILGGGNAGLSRSSIIAITSTGETQVNSPNRLAAAVLSELAEGGPRSISDLAFITNNDPVRVQRVCTELLNRNCVKICGG